MPPTMLANGERPIDQDSRDYPIVVLGSIVEKDTSYLFESEQVFEKWIRSMGLGNVLRDVKRRIEDARQYESMANEHPVIAARQARIAKHIEAEMQDLALRSGFSLSSKEILLRATVEAPPLEGPVFDPLIAWQDVNFAGPSLYLPNTPGSWPDLRWLGWNDKISSFRSFGNVTTLFEHTWFQGRQCWAWAIPY